NNIKMDIDNDRKRKSKDLNENPYSISKIRYMYEILREDILVSRGYDIIDAHRKLSKFQIQYADYI
ncbi:14234_t:CDS:2, partial [Cetraspora pellucida]